MKNKLLSLALVMFLFVLAVVTAFVDYNPQLVRGSVLSFSSLSIYESDVDVDSVYIEENALYVNEKN